MRFNDGSTDRKAHPHALRLGRKERIEDVIHSPGINSRSGVFHRDQHAVAIADGRFDLQRSRVIGDGIHGFNRIRDEICDDLLQLDGRLRSRSARTIIR